MKIKERSKNNLKDVKNYSRIMAGMLRCAPVPGWMHRTDPSQGGGWGSVGLVARNSIPARSAIPGRLHGAPGLWM